MTDMRMPEVYIASESTRKSGRTTLINAAITIVFIALVILPPMFMMPPLRLGEQDQQRIEATVMSRATQEAVDQRSSLKAYAVLDLNGLPPSLTDTIAANLLTYTDIATVKHANRVPSKPPVAHISDAWCITIYPQATMTLYLASGEKGTASIDHIIALERENQWELYQPAAFNWTDLGC